MKADYVVQMLAVLVEQIEDLEVQVAERDNGYILLEDSVNTLKAESSGKDRKINELMHKNIELEEDLKIAEAEIFDLEEERASLESSLNLASSDLEDMQAQLQELKSEVEQIAVKHDGVHTAP